MKSKALGFKYCCQSSFLAPTMLTWCLGGKAPTCWRFRAEPTQPSHCTRSATEIVARLFSTLIGPHFSLSLSLSLLLYATALPLYVFQINILFSYYRSPLRAARGSRSSAVRTTQYLPRYSFNRPSTPSPD